MNFYAKLSDKHDSLYVNARGEDRPNVIAEVTGALESEGLYVASIVFNLTSPAQDHFLMEIVAKGDERKLAKCSMAIDTGSFLPSAAESRQWPEIRWSHAPMFHIGLFTPDRAGLVARISRIVGTPHRDKTDRNTSITGTFVHLIGAMDNSGGAQGGTPYFSLRANVAVQTVEIQEAIIDELQKMATQQGFAQDMWVVRLNR